MCPGLEPVFYFRLHSEKRTRAVAMPSDSMTVSELRSAIMSE